MFATGSLIVPHGGVLVDVIAPVERAEELKQRSREWVSWDLTPRQLCDLELLMTGAFSPLDRFMGREDYDSVCSHMRLADGTLWPIPIVLDITDDLARRLDVGAKLALRDPEGVMLAVLDVAEMWRPDRNQEALTVYGTASREHSGVSHLLDQVNPWYVAGRLEGIQLPAHYDFVQLRRTPSEVRAEIAAKGWKRVVAFQTRNPMHRAHQELTRRAAANADANLLIHPVVGLTKPGDVDHYTRVRCYQLLLDTYPPGSAMLSLLPLAMRMAGPREAVWHAVIRKNYGCTHFIVGRDHAGPGNDRAGRPFYGPYDAQVLVRANEIELGLTMVPFQAMVYVENLDQYVPSDEVPPGAQVRDLSGTQLRSYLGQGRPIPEWFTFPAVAAELQRTHPPRARQGITIFFTGLSGAGKSTIANVLLSRLLETGGRRVSLLDGDLVRKHLSSELGFSREHRDLNIRRIGYVASEITKNGGVAICAPIAPYDSTRKEVRHMVEPFGAFVLVHVATPVDVCEQRDRKGLYAKARAGLIQQFTGVNDPYEQPEDATITIDTTSLAPERAADAIFDYLLEHGYLSATAEVA